jgi:uncharacterized DUF497 family protein
MPVVISFDPAKRAGNLAKHGLDLAEAEQVLAGPCAERLDDRFDYGEPRWVSLGLLRGEVVACVWTERDEEARVISLRKASVNEQKEYFSEIGG